jgi:nucleoside-diphosphate-sugar epimerase
MKQISILGCGWLGLPLAKHLIQLGYRVKGSTTNFTKCSSLEDLGILPYQIEIYSEQIVGQIIAFLEESDVLIINIPPKLRGNEKEDFVSKMQQLISYIEYSSVSKVVFISSTSVYSDTNEQLSEETVHEPTTESGKQLLASEALLKKNTAFQTTVIRFGGLIGEDRHPIRFLAGRKNIEDPDAPINLIHLDDCIGIITRILESGCWNETFNAVAPFHPRRKEYYVGKATEMNLPMPEFNSDDVSNGKTILSDKVQNVLKYQFKVNPL